MVDIIINIFENENGKKKDGIILAGQPEVMLLLTWLDQGAFGTADMGLAYSQVRAGRYKQDRYGTLSTQSIVSMK